MIDVASPITVASANRLRPTIHYNLPKLARPECPWSKCCHQSGRYQLRQLGLHFGRTTLCRFYGPRHRASSRGRRYQLLAVHLPQSRRSYYCCSQRKGESIPKGRLLRREECLFVRSPCRHRHSYLLQISTINVDLPKFNIPLHPFWF